jgi:hypothetical protein
VTGIPWLDYCLAVLWVGLYGLALWAFVESRA